MQDSQKPADKNSWAIGGGLLLGLGVGFFYLEWSALAFVGCIIGGLGLGLLVASILAAVSK